ncbi:signal transduction histidine kinase [Salirhabdus euzebyi]|uniref:histidine kinase n=1 Tax=Salirhabdus euzebyi TaxID=394506 RepID=A0A841Q601_9BACI|nr:HAMP domain-containing sensor histidine kinase [Salirhabdus euzebyi]MBB6453840.1 signal transduction histidine kinase [Salirhabdus euzebyi]
MRIKYIFQLIGSQISVLIFAFLILSLLFSHYVEELVYQNKVDELISYGEKILNDLDSHPLEREQIPMTQYSEILRTRDIFITLFDEQGKVIYPQITDFPITKLSEQEWTTITEGRAITLKRDLERFDQAVSLVAAPYIQNGQFLGGILLTAPISGSREMITELNEYLLFTVAIALSIAIILSWLMSKLHVNRIKRIQDATSAIANGNYKVHVPSSNFDEIGELANDFNQMAKQLNLSMEEIKRLEKRRRQFIADVSHELRTPLTTINGLIEGLRNDMISEQDKEKGMDLISKETNRLIRLVNENLDYEKIRSNQIKLTKVELKLKEVFEIIKEHLDLHAQEKDNTILMDVEDNLTVYADYDRIIQILINIVKNSIQFTENGTIWMRGRASSTETIIELEDNGIGIDPKDIESIWLRFYKADLSRKNNPYGESGLGLSIVKQLVHLHNGDIKINSTKNKGTKFTIHLPKKNM